MTQTSEDKRKEIRKMIGSLERESQRLQAKALRFFHAVGKEDYFKYVEEGPLRIYNSNAGLNLRDVTHIATILSADSYNSVSDLDDRRRVFEGFSQRGDELSTAIVAFLHVLGREADYVLAKERVSQKLVSRGMTKTEYYGYLNGDAPITSTDGLGPIYLPKRREVHNETTS